MEQNFPQIPIELYSSPMANTIMEELVLKRNDEIVSISKYEMEDLYFVLGIDYWVGDKKDYPILVLTWSDQ